MIGDGHLGSPPIYVMTRRNVKLVRGCVKISCFFVNSVSRRLTNHGLPTINWGLT